MLFSLSFLSHVRVFFSKNCFYYLVALAFVFVQLQFLFFLVARVLFWGVAGCLFFDGAFFLVACALLRSFLFGSLFFFFLIVAFAVICFFCVFVLVAGV